jgi:nucleoside-diphosphate-sugar epimerase
VPTRSPTFRLETSGATGVAKVLDAYEGLNRKFRDLLPSSRFLYGFESKRRNNQSGLRCAPKGVNGRNSDNTLIQRYLHWEPDTTLREGLEKTYAWIHDQYLARQRGEAGVVREAEVSR